MTSRREVITTIVPGIAETSLEERGTVRKTQPYPAFRFQKKMISYTSLWRDQHTLVHSQLIIVGDGLFCPKDSAEDLSDPYPKNNVQFILIVLQTIFGRDGCDLFVSYLPTFSFLINSLASFNFFMNRRPDIGNPARQSACCPMAKEKERKWRACPWMCVPKKEEER